MISCVLPLRFWECSTLVDMNRRKQVNSHEIRVHSHNRSIHRDDTARLFLVSFLPRKEARREEQHAREEHSREKKKKRKENITITSVRAETWNVQKAKTCTKTVKESSHEWGTRRRAYIDRDTLDGRKEGSRNKGVETKSVNLDMESTFLSVTRERSGTSANGKENRCSRGRSLGHFIEKRKRRRASRGIRHRSYLVDERQQRQQRQQQRERTRHERCIGWHRDSHKSHHSRTIERRETYAIESIGGASQSAWTLIGVHGDSNGNDARCFLARFLARRDTRVSRLTKSCAWQRQKLVVVIDVDVRANRIVRMTHNSHVYRRDGKARDWFHAIIRGLGTKKRKRKNYFRLDIQRVGPISLAEKRRSVANG